MQGLTTNRAFLVQVLEHPAFLAGELHTHFIDEHLAESLATTVDPETLRRALIAVALDDHERRRASSPLPSIPSGFRNNAHTPQRLRLALGETEHEVAYRHHARERGRFTFTVGDTSVAARVLGRGERTLRFEVDGLRQTARIVDAGDIGDGQDTSGPVDLPDEPAQHRPGTYLNIRVDALRCKATHDLLPPNRLGYL